MFKRSLVLMPSFSFNRQKKRQLIGTHSSLRLTRCSNASCNKTTASIPQLKWQHSKPQAGSTEGSRIREEHFQVLQPCSQWRDRQTQQRPLDHEAGWNRDSSGLTCTPTCWEFWHRLADLKKGSNESVAVAKPGLCSSTQTLIPRVHEVRRAQPARCPDEEDFFLSLSSPTTAGSKYGRLFHVSRVFLLCGLLKSLWDPHISSKPEDLQNHHCFLFTIKIDYAFIGWSQIDS